MAYGCTGKMLIIDLTSGDIRIETLPETLSRHFVGGAGLGVASLYRRQRGGVDALGDENILGFMPGLLSGTGTPGSSRLTVVSKSPLTGAWGESNAGGHGAREIKRAGYDGILFCGRSPKPVYLMLDQGKAELRDASHLWGKDTIETEDAIRNESEGDGVRIGSIGRAGELLSRIASITFDGGRAAGRQGLGAVMGSKRLKAVAVRGSSNVNVAVPDLMASLRRSFGQQLRDSNSGLLVHLREGRGTVASFEANVGGGSTPIKNWSLAGQDAIPFYDKIGGTSVNRFAVDGSRGAASCADCPVACGALIALNEADAPRTHRPEYETVAGFGAMCFNDDVGSILRANDICNRYGMDTMSASTAIAFAIECYERGIIGKHDTDGLEITWNNAGSVIALLEKMVRREGFGDVLADGVQMAAARIGRGAETYAIHVGGQEPGYHDGRLAPARGVSYMCDATPGRHMSCLAASILERGGSIGEYPEFATPKSGPREYQNKKELYGVGFKYEQFFTCCGLCKFFMTAGPVPLIELIRAATGWDITPRELLETGERILTLRQLFNIREGVKPSGFDLPPRLAQPAATGPLKGISVDWEALRLQYLKGIGWSQTGYPLPERVRELGLQDLVDELPASH